MVKIGSLGNVDTPGPAVFNLNLLDTEKNEIETIQLTTAYLTSNGYDGTIFPPSTFTGIHDSYNRFNPYFHMLCILHVCYGWTHNTWTLSAICQQYWIIKYNIFNIVRFAVTPWNDNIRGGFDQTNNNTDICIAQWPIQIYYTAHYKKYKTSREKKAKQIHLRSKNELNG